MSVFLCLLCLLMQMKTFWRQLLVLGIYHGLLQLELYPEDFNQAAESSNNVWSCDDFVETFDPEQHNHSTVLC